MNTKSFDTPRIKAAILAICGVKDLAGWTEWINGNFSPAYASQGKMLPQVNWATGGAHNQLGSLTFSAFQRAGVGFSLGYYPVCCGALMLYNFSASIVAKHVTQAQFNELMDAIFEVIYSTQKYGEDNTGGFGPTIGSRRIITMMVEPGSRGQGFDRKSNIPNEEVNPNRIWHKELYHYWLTQDKVNDRLMFNENSGNILHDMEVIMKGKF